MSTTVTSVPVVIGLPYFEDFESGEGGWYAEMEGDEESGSSEILKERQLTLLTAE